jgi:hypothetical protein
MTSHPKVKGEGEGKLGGGERRALVQALETGLEEVRPGLTIIDRDLRFDGGARADLAAVDSAGRLALIQIADEDADRAALDALDALALLRREPALVARHLRRPGVDALREPLLILVQPNADEPLASRLAGWIGHGLELFIVRHVESEAGARSYLVPMGRDPSAPGEDPTRPFFERADAPGSELARTLMRRVQRLDAELEVVGGADGLLWRFRGRPLMRIDRLAGQLTAGVAPRFEARAIATPADLDPLLEAALASILEATGSESPPLTELPGEAELTRTAPLTLLTQEELQAFRE